jgi:mannitol operon repressor
MPASSGLNVHAYNDLVDRFHDETDRAAGVLACAYLDAYLEDLLRTMWTKGKRTDDLFHGQGALRSLSSKIALLYALGIVDDAAARDLDLIRKIRNHFAHDIWNATFDQSPVRDMCSEIRLVATGTQELTSPRERFLLGVAFLIGSIAVSAKVPDEFCERMTGVRRG